ncbi:hypothetical protein OAP01_08355 [Akkermansiaceae bacterium]|nr:hypothetical protein [Akkermansiaceae bacterium]
MLFSATITRAEVISFNFHATSVNNQRVFGKFGVEPADNWINSSEDMMSALQNSEGNATTVDMTRSGGARSGSFSGAPLNGSPMKAGLQFFGASSPPFTLSQIPYANYKIIVYLTGFNGNNASFVSDGNSTFYWDPKAFSSILTETLQTTYEEGTDAVKSNYAVFGSDAAPLTDTSITISFGLAPLAPGASGGGGIGGFQIVSLPDPPTTVKPEVKEVSFDSVSSLLSLTWSSDPGQTYAVKASTDLSNWGLELATSIDAREDSDTTTEEIDLSGVLELEDQKQIYFRVERL